MWTTSADGGAAFYFGDDGKVDGVDRGRGGSGRASFSNPLYHTKEGPRATSQEGQESKNDSKKGSPKGARKGAAAGEQHGIELSSV